MRIVWRHIVATALLTTGVWSVADGTVSAAPKKETIVVRVVDQDGAARVGATALACPVIAGQQDCSSAVAMSTNAAGYAHLRLDATTTYGVFSFVSNPQPPWACAGFVIGDQELYLSERIEAVGAQLPKSIQFTISEPSPLDCAVVTVTDDSGNPLPTAGLFVCAHTPGSDECIGDRFEGPDGDGVIRMKIDPNLVYDLGTFIANSGWPCPGYEAPDGTLFHFGSTGSFTAADFLAGITLVIPKPDLSDCTPGTVTVTDDSGHGLPTAGLFVCAHAPGSQDCIGDRFENADPDGIIRIDVDPTLDYDLGAYIANPGWPCPSFFLADGTVLFFGESRTFTADQLLSGVVMVIPEPSAEDCVQVSVVDDSGNPLPNASVVICAHAPGSTDCVGKTIAQAGPSGVASVPFDPTLIYDLKPSATDTGWPCPSFIAPDGTTTHVGAAETFTAEELLAGVTLVLPQIKQENCVVVAVTDDSGNPLPTAGLFVCAHDPGGPCLGDRFEGPDPDGVIRMAIEPGLLYDLGAFIANSGWPCPGYVADDGTTFHFSPNGTYSTAELQAGVTLVIAIPSPDACPT